MNTDFLYLIESVAQLYRDNPAPYVFNVLQNQFRLYRELGFVDEEVFTILTLVNTRLKRDLVKED